MFVSGQIRFVLITSISRFSKKGTKPHVREWISTAFLPELFTLPKTTRIISWRAVLRRKTYWSQRVLSYLLLLFFLYFSKPLFRGLPWRIAAWLKEFAVTVFRPASLIPRLISCVFVFSFAAVKNSCDSEFLKCEHECYEPNKGRAECRCRDGYTLQSDGQSCAGETPLSKARPALGF